MESLEIVSARVSAVQIYIQQWMFFAYVAKPKSLTKFLCLQLSVGL